MPKKQSKPPSYCLHKASGQAVVRIRGKDRYLGVHGSSESYERYERAIAEWRAGQVTTPASGVPVPLGPVGTLLINELLIRYIGFAESYYVDASGQPTREFLDMKYALRPLRRLFGRTPVASFGPRALKTIRQHLIEKEDLSRKVVNQRINRIRRLFKWAVSEELAPPSVYEGLRSVDGLRAGRTTAREAPPIKPVSQEYVDAVVAAVSPQIATMIQLQLLGGMRPSEVARMRVIDIDRSEDIWMFRPINHKNTWRDLDRGIFLGPRAQELLKPFLNRRPDEFLFSPREAEEWRSRQRRIGRRSPMTPSQARRKPKRHPRRAKGDRYDRDSYRRAITYAINRINRERRTTGLPEIPHWCPLQLRHSRATEIRRTHGLEASQIYLGHRHAAVTEIYAERDLGVGRRIAREIG